MISSGRGQPRPITKEKVSLLNLPNALTALRIVLIPAFAWSYYCFSPVLSVIIFLVASFTDFLDGYLARKWNQITAFGKLFDPLADKLMTIAALYCLADTGYIAWWVVIAIVLKELIMVLGSLFMLGQKVVVHANYLGKAATVLFIAAVALVFPWHPVNALSTVGTVLLYLAVALSVAAMLVYGYQFLIKKRRD